MQHNFTHNDFVRLAYGEVTISERLGMNEAMKADPVLAGEFREIREAKALLCGEKYQPSNSSIRIIMDHSRQSRPMETC